MVSTPVIHVIHVLLLIKPIPKGWKAEFDWLVDPQRTLYPPSGHLSTINQASGKVRQPETDVLDTEPRPLDLIKQRLLFIYHAVAEQKISQKCIQMVVGDSEYIMIAQDKVGCLTADGNVDDVDLHRAPKHN